MSLGQTKEKKFTGFKGSLNVRLRNSNKWKYWREQVFKRDNHTCLDCGTKGKYLHPHHIVPVKECLLMDYKELVFDIINGNTLCVKCHKDEHTMGGD